MLHRTYNLCIVFAHGTGDEGGMKPRQYNRECGDQRVEALEGTTGGTDGVEGTLCLGGGATRQCAAL